MAKKIKTTAKKSKTKKAAPEQLKIEGTGRIDAIPSLEKAAEDLRKVRAQRMELAVEEGDLDEALTDEYAKHKLEKPYKYVGGDGKLYVLKPTKVKVRVHRVPEAKGAKS